MDHTLFERDFMVGESGIVAQLKKAARRYAMWAWINVGIAVIGGLATLASYSATAPGGRYVAFGGAILWGLVFAVINAVRYFRARSAVRAVSAAARPASAPGPAPQENPATQVFNPPPGWPSGPEGWRPFPGWQPDPSWPAPPPGWSLLVDRDLRMRPVSLNEDLDFGEPSRVTKKHLNEAADRAADAIAWRICTVAVERNQNPLTTLGSAQEHVREAVGKAKARIFTKLLADANARAQRSQANIQQWEAALQHTRMIMEKREAFDVRVHKRINAVVSAAVTPARAPDSRPAAQPPAYSPPAKKDSNVGLLLTVGLLALVGVAVFAIGISQSGPTSLGSAEPSMDPAVLADLQAKTDWHRSGDFYAKWVPNGQYTCNSGVPCTELWIQTPLTNGCKSADAAVDMLRNGVVIGTYHGNAKNMTKGVERRIHIEARTSAQPDEVQLNRVACLD